ncbi:hypothetical protein, partial [Salmonella enterica]|uniref:hypothetical protein n=1 Tax=Salmonella enterica TaxID=28901 RepID=UPI0020C31196
FSFAPPFKKPDGGVIALSGLRIYSSSFLLLLRWLRSFTPVTYLCSLLKILSLAAVWQLEGF